MLEIGDRVKTLRSLKVDGNSKIGYGKNWYGKVIGRIYDKGCIILVRLDKKTTGGCIKDWHGFKGPIKHCAWMEEESLSKENFKDIIKRTITKKRIINVDSFKR